MIKNNVCNSIVRYSLEIGNYFIWVNWFYLIFGGCVDKIKYSHVFINHISLSYEAGLRSSSYCFPLKKLECNMKWQIVFNTTQPIVTIAPNITFWRRHVFSSRLENDLFFMDIIITYLHLTINNSKLYDKIMIINILWVFHILKLLTISVSFQK